MKKTSVCRSKSILTLSVILLAIFAATSSALAGTTTLSTGGSDSWNTGSWSGGVPSGEVDAVIAAGVQAGVNNANTPSYVGTLTLGDGSKLALERNDGSENALNGATSLAMGAGTELNIRGSWNLTFPQITLTGDNAAIYCDNDWQTYNFDSSITGNHPLVLKSFNGTIFDLKAANSFTSLTADATDRWVLKASAQGALGLGDVTVNPRASADLRSAVLVIAANDAMADVATLTLNGKGWADSDKGSYQGTHVLLDMQANDTIGGLVIDGQTMPYGDYTAASGDWITGTGTLSVVYSGETDPVPNVVNMTQANAQTEISSAGFNVGTITPIPHETIAAGVVVSQNPVAGAMAVAGAFINLNVSTGPDTESPTPATMTWQVAPTQGSDPYTQITMTAALASDPSGVEYLFTCTAGGGHSSGWQDSRVYTDSGLTPDTQYAYTVTARDKSTAQNATNPSAAAVATTANGYVPQVTSPTVGQESIDTDSSSLNLQWSVASDVDSHQIYLGTANPPTTLVGTVADTAGSAQAYTYTGSLEKDTTYYWQIKTVHAGGPTAGGVWSFKTEPEASLIVPNEIIYIKRKPYTTDHYYTVNFNGTDGNNQFQPANGIYIYNKDTGQHRKVVSAADMKNQFPALSGNGIIGKMTLSFDATKVVFDYRDSYHAGFRIWEVNTDGTGLRQITTPPADEAEKMARFNEAEYKATDDMHPAYLPDGDIIFTSTRCEILILCDWVQRLPTSVLHRCDPDGTNIEQLTQSPVSEFCPVVLDDGKVMYHRWEYVDKGVGLPKCFFTMNPDGTMPTELYGISDDTNKTFMFPQMIPGEHKLVCVETTHYKQSNCLGAIHIIDLSKDTRTGYGLNPTESGFVPGPQANHAIYSVTPEVVSADRWMEKDSRERGWLFLKPGSTFGSYWNFVHDEDGDQGHLYAMPYPVSSTEFLVSYKYETGDHWCNVPDAYGIGLLNIDGTTELIFKDETDGLSCWNATPIAARPTPPKVYSHRSSTLAAQNKALCIVADVYQGMGDGVQRGEVKWLRVNEDIPLYWDARKYNWMSDGDYKDYVARSEAWKGALWVRAQHGVVPVESDGSANFYVPADRNVFLQALDEDFREIQRERTYVNYRPGEIRSCVGCHTKTGKTPPKIATSTPLAMQRGPSELQAQPCDLVENGGDGRPEQVIHYPSDIQPIFDAKCVSCHGGASPGGGLSLEGTLSTEKSFGEYSYYNLSYYNLYMTKSSYGDVTDERLGGRMIQEIWEHGSDDHDKYMAGEYLPPKSLGCYTSPMIQRLAGTQSNQCQVLTENELMILSRWVDTNYQFYGTYYGVHHGYWSDKMDPADFRRKPTFEEATSNRKPAWHVSPGNP